MLGRDASSVFPTEAKAAALDPEALKAVIGGDRKFISATEVRRGVFACPGNPQRLSWLESGACLACRVA